MGNRKDAIEAYEKLKREMGIHSEHDKTTDWDQLIFVVKAAIEFKRLKEKLINAKRFEEEQLRQAVAANEALNREAEKLFQQKERVIRAECQKEHEAKVKQVNDLAREKMDLISKDIKAELDRQLQERVDIQNRTMVRDMVDKFRDFRQHLEDTVEKVSEVLLRKEEDFNTQDRFLQENKVLLELRNKCQEVEAALKVDKVPASNWTEQMCQVSKLAESMEAAFKGKDELGEAVLESLPALAVKRGVLTEIGLKARFEEVEKVAHNLAMLKGEGPHSGLAYVASYLRSMLTVRNKYCNPDLTSDFVPEELDNADLLFRACACMKNNDFMNAVKFVERLKGAPTKAVAGWLNEARSYLKVKQATQILKHYCTLKINRSCYKSPVLIIDNKPIKESQF
ncbi:MICOS complex subunit Mic60-like [Neocloeon triangulifer]|uniref:MICOS complex subunit Mic60-like n=1 Tax=Neocloeon triangulifer TaxID=2078957 RepID=UPI00286EB9FC|nr:MICOS complex subunit Mic60-like [Neocloeon triangulifer]